MKNLTGFIISATLLFAGCNQQPPAQNHTPTLTAEEAKALAKDAYLFGMPVVFIEIQFDYNSHASNVEKNKAPVNQFVHYRAF